MRRHAHHRLHVRHDLNAGMHPGHALTLFTDPFEAWQALRADLDGAKVSITIELYMLRDDPIGQAFALALGSAVERGVEVRLTLDGVGSLGLSRRLEETLRHIGVHLAWYNRLGPALPVRRWTRRNHRKVFVIDREVAWVQGQNVTSDYYALAPGVPCWADAAMRIRGPLVAQVAHELRAPGPQPPPWQDPAGQLATIAFNRGGVTRAEAHQRYLQAMRLANRTIRIVQAYFLPEQALVRALGRAVDQGRDVRVVMPDLATGDVVMVSLASMHAIGKLLARGVRVWHLQGRMVHAKLAVVDGAWWTVGSANLDPLSRQRNLEANAVGVGEPLATELTAYFDQLCNESRELTLQDWQRRPWWIRLLGLVAWWLRGFL
jgi:cardiolipin synthase